MSTERTLEEERDHKKNAEKQTMDAPQEEFVGDEAAPSRDISELRDRQEGDEVTHAVQHHAEYAFTARAVRVS
jgi:hypothetical protein